jgi:lysophospholipase L1-like esterase
MSVKSSFLQPEKLTRILLLVSALLVVLLLVLTVLNIVARIPEKPENTDPAQTSGQAQTDESGNPVTPPAGEPAPDDVTLPQTPDGGLTYQDSLVFVGDSLTAHLINRGVLSGGTNTRQVWRSESNMINLNSEVTSAKIIFPGTGEKMTIAEAAAEAKPSILIITLGTDWGVSYLSEDEFKACYEKLVKAIQKESPHTTIILQSIFPVTAACATLDNAKIDTANKWVKAVAAANGCHYLDTQSILKDENNFLKAEYCNSSDGIHLGTNAYEAILGYIRTHAVQN